MDLSDDDITSDEEISNDEEQLADKGPETKEDSIEDAETDLDASATDSDEDELENNIEEKKCEIKKSKKDKVTEAIYQRYKERQGKQLFIRFPHKVPETQEALDQMVKELTPLAIKAHKPRQRHVRYCLIDFTTKEDRDATLNMLKKSIKKGDLKKFAVNIPRTESLDFVQELAERKIKSIENKKAKLRLKRASKNALKENKFTSSVVVLNLPKSASSLEVRELFANAVDINIKPGKGKMRKDTTSAAVTFPTTLDARNAVKKNLSMGGNKLIIKFDNKKLIKKTKSKTKPNPKYNEKPISVQSEPVSKYPMGGNKLKFDNKKLIKKTNQKSKKNTKDNELPISVQSEPAAKSSMGGNQLIKFDNKKLKKKTKSKKNPKDNVISSSVQSEPTLKLSI